MEAVWNVFENGGYAGIVSLGSGIKSGSNFGHCGDLTAAYGGQAIKILRVTATQLKYEISVLKAEVAEEDEQISFDELVSLTSVYSAAQKVVSQVNSSESTKDILLDSSGLLPRIIRPQQPRAKKSILLLYNISRHEISGDDEDVVGRLVSAVSFRLDIEIRLFGASHITGKESKSPQEIVEGIIIEDCAYFLQQVPPVLNFDVTGGFCLISDITNLSPAQALKKLDWQRDNPPPSTSIPTALYRKSDSAFQFLRRQIESEKQFRVINHTLRPIISDGERVLICSIKVKQKLINMADRMGSAEEKRRARMIFLPVEERAGLKSNTGEFLDGIPTLQVLGVDSFDEMQISLDDEWIEREVLATALEYTEKTRNPSITVTGNLKVAKKLVAKSDRSSWLVINSRSLTGGY